MHTMLRWSTLGLLLLLGVWGGAMPSPEAPAQPAPAPPSTPFRIRVVLPDGSPAVGVRFEVASLGFSLGDLMQSKMMQSLRNPISMATNELLTVDEDDEAPGIALPAFHASDTIDDQLPADTPPAMARIIMTDDCGYLNIDADSMPQPITIRMCARPGVMAEESSYRLGDRDIATNEEPMIIRLVPSCQVDVRYIDPETGGSCVKAWIAYNSPLRPEQFTQDRMPMGVYRIARCPKGVVTIVCLGPGYMRTRVTIDTSARDAMVVEVPARTGGVVRGVVKDATGNPCAFAEVREYATSLETDAPFLVSTRANAQGEYLLRGVDPTQPNLLVQYRKINHVIPLEECIERVVFPPGEREVRIDPRLVPIDNGHLRIGIPSEPSMRIIRGRVLSADGAPVAHASVAVIRPVTNSQIAVTAKASSNTRGDFVLTVSPPAAEATQPEGRYLPLSHLEWSWDPDVRHRWQRTAVVGNTAYLKLMVSAPGLATKVHITSVGVDQRDICLDVSLAKGRTLDGTVMDASGRPIQGVALSTSVRVASGVVVPYLPKYIWLSLPNTATTDRNGRFKLNQLPDGIITIICRQSGYSSLVTRCVAGEAGVTIRMKDDGVITGRVIDEDGRPVKRFTVYAPLAESSTDRLPHVLKPRQYITRDGRFTVPGVQTGQCPYLYVTAEGFFAMPIYDYTIRTAHDPLNTPVTFRLRHIPPSTGTLIDASTGYEVPDVPFTAETPPQQGYRYAATLLRQDGSPLAGTRIEAWQMAGENHIILGQAITDVDGSFTMQFWKPQQAGEHALTLHIQVGRHAYLTDAPHYAIRLLTDGTVVGPEVLRLAGDSAVHGAITRADTGKPVAGARVRAVGFGEVVTGKDGGYRIANLPRGPIRVVFDEPGYVVDVVDLDTTRAATVTVPFRARAEVVARGTVTTDTGLTYMWVRVSSPVSVRVVGDAGQVTPRPYTIETLTDARGAFVLRGLDPTTKPQLTVAKPGFQTQTVAVPLGTGTVPAPHMRITLARGGEGVPTRIVYGHVTHVGGTPVVGASVQSTGSLSAVTTDARGYYALEVEAIEHALSVHGPGIATTFRHLVSDLDIPLDIAAEPERWFEGTVVDARGVPIAHAQVSAQLASYRAVTPSIQLYYDSYEYPDKLYANRETRTDAAGHFRFPQMPAGFALVTIQRDGFASISQVPVRIDEQRTFVMQRAGCLRFSVTDTTDQPILLHYVSISNPRSGVSGTYQLSGAATDTPAGFVLNNSDRTESLTAGDLVDVTIMADGYHPITLDRLPARAADDPDNTPIPIRLTPDPEWRTRARGQGEGDGASSPGPRVPIPGTTYDLPPDAIWLYAPRARGIVPEPAPVDVTMPPQRAEVPGQIIWTQCPDFSKYTLRISTPNGIAMQVPLNRDGSFIVPGLAPGTCRVELEMASTKQSIAVRYAGEARLIINLDDPTLPAVQGRASHHPSAILLNSLDGYTTISSGTVAADGMYRLFTPEPGTYQLNLQYPPNRLSRFGTWGYHKVTITRGTTRFDPDYSCGMSGMVIDQQTGKPLVYTPIVLYQHAEAGDIPSWLWITDSMTDAEGRFAIHNLPPGEWCFVAGLVDGGSFIPLYPTIKLTSGQLRTDITLHQPRTGQVMINVTDVRTGDPLPQFFAIATNTLGMPFYSLRTNDAVSGYTNIFINVPVGRYTANAAYDQMHFGLPTVSPPDFAAPPIEFEVKAGQTTVVNLPLSTSGALVFRTNPQGDSVSFDARFRLTKPGTTEPALPWPGGPIDGYGISFPAHGGAIFQTRVTPPPGTYDLFIGILNARREPGQPEYAWTKTQRVTLTREKNIIIELAYPKQTEAK